MIFDIQFYLKLHCTIPSTILSLAPVLYPDEYAVQLLAPDHTGDAGSQPGDRGVGTSSVPEDIASIGQ